MSFALFILIIRIVHYIVRHVVIQSRPIRHAISGSCKLKNRKEQDRENKKSTYNDRFSVRHGPARVHAAVCGCGRLRDGVWLPERPGGKGAGDCG